ncbi:MAG: hypothetical protein Q7S40_07045 [Opitutaceae bacterium]|nr:hypothetical protein [Opitutaceae bacterium]
MKNSRVAKGVLGLGSVLAFTLGLGNSAFAGPGPQYWQQQAQRAKARADYLAEGATPAAKPTAPPAMACPHCKTKVVEESSFTNVSGKIAPHSTVTGKRHYCDGCSGFITVARGKVSDEMKRNCPICAKAGPTCCSTNT